MKKPLLVASAFVLAFSSLGVISPKAYATAQTCTWTGGTDSKFSTAANWSNCNSSVPQAGDIASFDLSNIASNSADYKVLEIVNDSNPALAGIAVSSSSGGALILSQLSLGSGGTISTQGGYIEIGTITGGDPNNLTGGDIHVAGDFTSPSMLSAQSFGKLIVEGAFTVDSNDYNAYGVGNVTAGSLVLKAQYGVLGDGTINTPITFYDGASLKAVAAGEGTYSTELTGALTFHNTSPIPVTIGSGATLKITGQGADAAQFTKTNISTGTLQVGSTQLAATPKTTLIEGQQTSGASSDVSVGNMETTILQKDSVRSSAYVGEGGILKGLGTLNGSLYIGSGGIVAPGMSPGCITSNSLVLSGEYQFELGGTDPCDGYDQLKVLNAASSASAVQFDASTAILTTSRYNGYTPEQGDEFVIIDQAGDKAVSGTFKDLPEGATFTQNGVVFKISYVGGDGNDVTLTVQNSPTAPDTGVQLLKANPALIAAGTVIAFLALLGLARRAKQQR